VICAPIEGLTYWKGAVFVDVVEGFDDVRD
jgi:hypothetical protein